MSNANEFTQNGMEDSAAAPKSPEDDEEMSFPRRRTSLMGDHLKEATEINKLMAFGLTEGMRRNVLVRNDIYKSSNCPNILQLPKLHVPVSRKPAKLRGPTSKDVFWHRGRGRTD